MFRFYSGNAIRNPKTGLCIECGPFEPGEIIGGVRNDDRGGPKNFSVNAGPRPGPNKTSHYKADNQGQSRK